MKLSAAGLAAAAYPVTSAVNALAVQGTGINASSGKTLIACFSHSGNTRYMAGLIQERISGEHVEIRKVDSYPQDHDEVVNQARQEQNCFRPVLL